jgi:hypothetical protein
MNKTATIRRDGDHYRGVGAIIVDYNDGDNGYKSNIRTGCAQGSINCDWCEKLLNTEKYILKGDLTVMELLTCNHLALRKVGKKIVEGIQKGGSNAI